MALSIPLESCRALFANDEAMAAFANLLRAATNDVDTPMLTFKDEHVVTALSPAATQSVLRDRILRRLADRPELLEKFVTRVRDFTESDLVD